MNRQDGFYPPAAPSKTGCPVFRILGPFVALPRIRWHPYPSDAAKLGVGPRVARCAQM